MPWRQPVADREPRVQAAIDFQKLSSEAFWAQRQREDDDLEFQVPEKQWPQHVQVQRQGQTVQGVPLPPRPMLSIPSLNQPIQQVYNQWSRAHFGIHIAPKSQEANDDTAEIIQGLYRHIEVDSRAYIGRGWGLDRAIKAGFGAYRVDVVYDEDTDDPDDLKIVIRRILRQSSVYWDPFAVEPDFSDQRRSLIVSWISRDQFKRDFPNSKMAGMGNDELLELQSQMPNFATLGADGTSASEKLKWYDGANDAVCIAEFFYTEWRKDPIGGRRKTRNTPVIKWCKINAVEVLEENTWNGKYIPIIPVIGNELQPFDTERRWEGLIHPNKDAARLLNYEVTAAVEKDALSTKAPWIGAVGQFKTNQAAWLQANTRNFPYLEYDPVMAGGKQAPPPTRNLDSPDVSSAIALIQLAKDSLQTGTAIVDSSSLENLAKRKVAHQTLLGMQESNQISQSQYVQNMADLSMTYEAKVVLDLIPKIYDRAGRVASVLGEDNERKEVILNQEFIRHPKTGRPIAKPSDVNILPKGVQASTYDLQKGTYQVVVEVGKSYKTKAAEGSDALGQIMQSVPEMIQVVGDIWMGYQDFPGHKEAAERMKKMLPPQLQSKKDDENDPEAIKAQRDQAAQMVEQLGQQLQEAQKAIETDQAKQQADLQKAQMSAQVDVEKAKIDNQTKLQIAQMSAEVELHIAAAKLKFEQEKMVIEAQAKAALQDDQQRHEHAESAVDRAHEHATLAKQTQVAEAQAENAARRGFAQGEVDHAHAEAEGERGHERSMESQSQAEQAAQKQAALKPTPNGASA